MTTKKEMIEIIKAEFPTLRFGDEDKGYTELLAEEYETTIAEWADARLAKLQAKADAEALRQTKISAYEKLGLTESEIEALLPISKPRIRDTVVA
jgi:hypothetical protein